MNQIYRPNFKNNILGCLEKYGDVNGASKWFERAEKELSDEDFVKLVEETIENTYKDEKLFIKFFNIRDEKRINLLSHEGKKKAISRNEVISAIKCLLSWDLLEQCENYYKKNQSLLDNKEYQSLKEHYEKEKLTKKIKKIIIKNTACDENSAHQFAKAMVKKEPSIGKAITWDRVKEYCLKNFGSNDFTPNILLNFLKYFVKDMCKNKKNYDETFLIKIMDKILSSQQNLSYFSKSIWTILSENPKIFEKFSISHKKILDDISDNYPFMSIYKLCSFYVPPEISCLNFIIKHHISDDNLIILQKLSRQHNYYYCEMTVAALKAKNDGHKIGVKDVLDNLLNRLTKKIFYAQNTSKRPVTNILFPKCISFEENRFNISDVDNIFCEGRVLQIKDTGELYVLCRNRRCEERSELLESVRPVSDGNLFFDFIKKILNISTNEIMRDINFIQAMGALNRLNEIAERLVCGFGEAPGCKSHLMFSKNQRIRPGFAAYATTYWRCSNESCQYVNFQIKLSHCRGCRKIIDSRFDKISCNRKDGKEFYICIDCGYCCNEHEVSGICPVCGKRSDWQSIDMYGKKYRCENCYHEIAVPQWKKNCLSSNFKNKSGYRF